MKKIKCLYRKYKEIVNYIIVGFVTTLISLVTYYSCVFTILNPKNPIQLQVANMIAWVLSVTFAYFANRIYVFNSKNENKLAEAIKFVLSRISTLLIDMFFMFLFVTTLQLNDKVFKLLSQVIVFILNYIFSRFMVFSGNKK